MLSARAVEAAPPNPSNAIAINTLTKTVFIRGLLRNRRNGKLRTETWYREVFDSQFQSTDGEDFDQLDQDRMERRKDEG
jgi:hypothetical protein